MAELLVNDLGFDVNTLSARAVTLTTEVYPYGEKYGILPAFICVNAINRALQADPELPDFSQYAVDQYEDAICAFGLGQALEFYRTYGPMTESHDV